MTVALTMLGVTAAGFFGGWLTNRYTADPAIPWEALAAGLAGFAIGVMLAKGDE